MPAPTVADNCVDANGYAALVGAKGYAMLVGANGYVGRAMCGEVNVSVNVRQCPTQEHIFVIFVIFVILTVMHVVW